MEKYFLAYNPYSGEIHLWDPEKGFLTVCGEIKVYPGDAPLELAKIVAKALNKVGGALRLPVILSVILQQDILSVILQDILNEGVTPEDLLLLAAFDPDFRKRLCGKCMAHLFKTD